MSDVWCGGGGSTIANRIGLGKTLCVRAGEQEGGL